MKYVSFIILIFAYICYRIYAPHYQILKFNKEDNPYYIVENIFSEEDFKLLQNFAKNISFEITIKSDNNFEENFGSSDINEEGKCQNIWQYPNKNQTKCLVPNRIDAIKHYWLTGGYGAKKEYYKTLINRLMIFQKFFFTIKNETTVPVLSKLFAKKEYLEQALKVCENKPILDPFQVSFVVNLPGQETGLHYDTPWFTGADRLSLPSWLLVVMEQSKLYSKYRVPMIQGVAYLHEWSDYKDAQGGYYFYPKGPGGERNLIDALPNRALILDASLVAHGTQIFRPKTKNIFKIDKNKNYILKNNGESWDILDKQNLTKFTSIAKEDIRISMVWRQRCFETEEDRDNYHNNNFKNKFETQKVINELLDNLISEGKIKEKPKDEMEIIFLLLNNYVNYPFEDTLMPYNFCVLAEGSLEFLKPLFDLVCN